jgi:predicted nucleotide-binding protein (sugar kinase/HSP70/actin superfamily)
MGTSHIAFSMLLRNLGHEPVVVKPTQKTLTLGTQYSPEFACLPFKILLGTYLEAIEKGAELILTSGGIGPCRAGYYGVLHQKIIDDLGLNAKIIVFEPPRNLSIFDLLNKINYVIKLNKIKWLDFIHYFKLGWQKLKALDEIENYVHKIRPYETNKGDTTQAFEEAQKILEKAQTKEEIEEALQAAKNVLDNVPQDKSRQPLKIGIIGEIYVVLEPFANHHVETVLGELGVEVHRSISLTGYTSNSFIKEGEQDVIKAAHPYLNQLIGGHGINSIGETVLYARHGYDGVVQLAPFACIPEIVAKGILPKVQKDLGIPVLTLFLDEQTGKAGIETRLEAFVDLLKQKRYRANVQDKLVDVNL